MKRYLIVIEKAENNYGAFAPDVPGCGATGKTVEETVTLLKEALTGHLELMAEDGDPIPEPTIIEARFVDVDEPVTAKAKSA
jgi:predicted RNase H-like HicB family nuclease